MDTPNTTPIGNTPDPMMNQPMQNQPGKSSIGPVIGAIIIVLLLILGGLYVWGEKVNQESSNPEDVTGEQYDPSQDAAVIQFTEQGTSDDLNSIEADIQATSLDSIDSAAGNVNASVNAQ